ncbi:hypothetical protein ACRXCV_11620 [Halobacteriovorax sp. GFR7]|uniref:hypothetical protein n=1 Tax=unclassified Halobacteriovorax TaxID=2639665 RepID=UPI00371A27DD
MSSITNNANEVDKKKPEQKTALKSFLERLKAPFLAFDRKVDGAISFFIAHYGKTKFMVAMSKKIQYLGIEGLWNKGPKAFIYFFLFYLIRDTILYIIIPIWLAKATS